MSPRKLPWIVGLSAALLSIVLLFSGAYLPLDAWWQGWLGFVVAPTPFPRLLEIAAVLLLGLGAALVGADVETPWQRRFLLGAGLFQPLSATAIAALAHVWFSPFACLTSMLLAMGGMLAWQLSPAGQKKSRLRRIFDDRLSEASLLLLTRQPDLSAPASAPATVLAAQLTAGDWLDVQSGAELLKQRGAWVETQAGNHVLALFNLPVNDPLHPATATNAALELARKNPAWQIGLACGNLTSGVSTESEVFQVSGALLDQAQRVCQANETFSSQILADLPTFDAVQKEFVLRPLGFLETGGAEIYEPLAALENAAPELLAQRDWFWKGLIFSRQQNFRDALDALQKAGDDAVTRRFRARLEASASLTETRG